MRVISFKKKEDLEKWLKSINLNSLCSTCDFDTNLVKEALNMFKLNKPSFESVKDIDISNIKREAMKQARLDVLKNIESIKQEAWKKTNQE